MKNIIKMLSFLAFFLVSQQAFAVCYTNASQIPNGSLPLHPSSNGGALCTTKSEADGQWGGGQGVTLITTHQPIILQRVPAGYGGYNPCTTEQAIHRGVLMATAGAVAGGVAGLLIGDNHRSAAKGAGAGVISGTLYAMSTECRVTIPQGTVAGQGVSGQVLANGTTSGVACKIGGDVFLLATEADCAKKAMQTASASGNKGVNTPDGKIACNIDTGTEKFRFNYVKGVHVDKTQCDRYLSKQDQLPSKADMQLL